MSYAGDVTPQEAWDTLAGNPRAVLIDVRTKAEWNYVGIPDLSGCGKDVLLIEWIVFPQMAQNAGFIDQIRENVPDQDQPILFLCRSGVRSVAAAQSATAAGYSNCRNVLDGFEGDMDAERHRNTLGGWRQSGLSWVQG